MHTGYLTSGLDSPFMNDDWVELINSRRAAAYARYGGIPWLEDCASCASSDPVVPGAPPDGYVSPAADPAPWYDPDNPDSWGFYGVVGVEVSGDEDSTRTVQVTKPVLGGAVMGAINYGPRTLVFRALLVAADDCSLSFGLNWLREQCAHNATPCSGDTLTFFDCCPCLCSTGEDGGGGGPCWPEDYAALRDGPSCDPDWWPATYAELRTGPPSGTEWCGWVIRYKGLRLGPSDLSCCIDECVLPYMRQFHNTAVTEGPTLLNRPEMSLGAMAEVELTITCGDPFQYALPILVGAAAVNGGARLAVEQEPVSPFDVRARTPVAAKPRVPEPDGGWVRHTQTTGTSNLGPLLSAQRMSFQVRNGVDRAERVRIGVWDGDERVAGYLLPFVPPRSTVIIDSARRVVEAAYDNVTDRLNGFVKDWDGGPAKFPNLRYSPYTVTVDQEFARNVELVITAAAVPVGAT